MCAVWVGVVMAAMAAVQAAQPSPMATETPLTIDVYVEGRVPDAPLAIIPEVAATLLARAGVRAIWRFCTITAPCPHVDGWRPTITVMIRHAAVDRAPQRCATAMKVPSRARGTVIVHHACMVDALAKLRYGPAVKTFPRLGLLNLGELAGLIVAHEIGHIAGLRHADTGIMHAQLGPNDIVAFQEGSLAFARTEAAVLRTALLTSETPAATARRAVPE